jgi:tRNA modification GTPase
LREHLKGSVGFAEQNDGGFSARRRHLDALQRARAHVEAGIRQLEQQGAGELLAEELRQAQEVLGEITGSVSSDDLLGRIFSSFCIGK